MTLIRRPTPFGELLSLRQAMDRLFEDSFVRPRPGMSAEDHALALDVYTTPDALVVEAALPGVKPDDVDISVLGDILTISGSTNQEQAHSEDGYSYREIRRGSFTRTVTLPTGLKADAATASFENGLLRLSFPKAEEAKPRQIQIKPTTEGQVTAQSSQSMGEVGQQSVDQSAAAASAAQATSGESAKEWQSTNGWQSGEQWQPADQSDQWQSNAPGQSGANEESNAQAQVDEQPRVEQAS